MAVSGNAPPGEYRNIHCDSLAACLSGTFGQVLLAYTCILYDCAGKEAWRAAVRGERLAVPSLPTGFYVLTVVDASGTFVFSQKMLKR